MTVLYKAEGTNDKEASLGASLEMECGDAANYAKLRIC